MAHLFRTNTKLIEINVNVLKITVPIGLGDLIYTKAMLDNIKHRFSEIHINIYRDIISFYGIDSKYNKFIDEIGSLFFSETPYILTSENIPFYGLELLCRDNNITPVKPELKHLLCKGTPIDIGDKYIAIVTKVRYVTREHFENKKQELFKVLQELSQKYKIVILGERVVELNGGYVKYAEGIYSIYDDIIQNIPADRVVDLSVPALGITAPDLTNIQQDCLTLSGAEFAITIGVGGGFCMATAVANTIGYRIDEDSIANTVFNKEYPNAIITKDWRYFLYKLRNKL